jgi:ATP-dependent Clp protease ATP-binding subunit ClpA
MYERFTDRARKVMNLAIQEAKRLNHEYVGTEHLFLGLIKEGSGVAANVLSGFDYDLSSARKQIEKLCPRGPDMVLEGKLPQTSRVKKVIEYSIEAARARNHNYVGTEHLLIGLATEKEGIVSQFLDGDGIREDVIAETDYLLGFREKESVQAKIDVLKARKDSLVAEQDFEGAAATRDEIDKLEKSLVDKKDVYRVKAISALSYFTRIISDYIGQRISPEDAVREIREHVESMEE